MTRLVLLGGGHAHVLVLRSFADFTSKNLDVKLVTPGPLHTYSGMVPGVVAGHYAVRQAQIDLAPLAARAGVELVLSSATSIDPEGKSVRLENGETISYDVASLNLGSLPDFSGAPGASEHAIGVKPFEPFIARWNELMGKLSAQGAREPRIAIAGAGAAGVELAMAMMFSLNQQGRRAKVVVFSDKDSFTPDVSARVRRALTRLSIELRGNTPANAVAPGPVLVSAAGREPFDAVFWAAGAAALPWLSESGLKTDPAGFVQIDAALRSVTHPEVFAAGDCASLERNPLPKSGVYAVRQGPVLAANLKRAILGKALERYEPQAKTLYLISCGGKYAIANRGSWSAEGRWAWTWKNWIDRRWIARFR